MSDQRPEQATDPETGGEQPAGLLPLPRRLHRLDLGEVDRQQQKDPVLLTPRELGVSLWTGPGAEEPCRLGGGG